MEMLGDDRLMLFGKQQKSAFFFMKTILLELPP